MSLYLYSFVGGTTALNHYLKTSKAHDKDDALAATAELKAIIEDILNSAAGDSSEETFKALFGQHVTTVLEAIKVIRKTSAHQELDATLTNLLEYFYAAANALMGGGTSQKPLMPADFSQENHLISSCGPKEDILGSRGPMDSVVGSFGPVDSFSNPDSHDTAVHLDSFFK